jgi:hypothetical protein
MLLCGRPGTDIHGLPYPFARSCSHPFKKILRPPSRPYPPLHWTSTLDSTAPLAFPTPRSTTPPAPWHPCRRSRLRCPLSHRAGTRQGCAGPDRPPSRCSPRGARVDARPGYSRSSRRCSPRPPSRSSPRGTLASSMRCC